MSNNLFSEAEDGAVLCATRCWDCTATFFPRSSFCRSCGSRNVASSPLARTGCIETFTRLNGVAVGDVRLDDGVLVFGRIEPSELASVGIAVRFSPSDEIVRFEIDA